MADPILERIVRDLAEARAAHPEEFSKLSKDDLNAFIQEESRGRYGLHDLTDVNLRNLGRSLFQGLSFNFGDELTGLLGGDKEEMRLRDELFRQAHPLADATSGIIGSLPLLAVPGLGEAGEGAEIGAALKAGAKSGALAGALYGAGSGENGAERFVRSATGGLAGGVLGAAIPGALAAGKAAFNPARAATRRLLASVQSSGGIQKLLDELNVVRAAGRGSEVMTTDLSPRMAREGDFAANNSDEALVDAAQKIRGRGRDQASRLLNDVRDVVGDPIASERQDALARDRIAFGEDAYGRLADQAGDIDIGDLAARLSQPTIKRAYEHARLADNLLAKSPIDAQLQRLMAANPGVDRAALENAARQGLLGDFVKQQAASPRAVSFNDLQQLKRALDGKAGEAYRAGNKPLAESYKTIRDEVKAALTTAVPDYAKVDAQYAAKKELEETIDRGLDAWDEEDSRKLASDIAEMTPDQLREFRLAMASGLIARLRSASTNRDMAARLLHGGAALEDKLRIVFGSPEVFDGFMKKLHVEGEIFGRVKGAIAGSETARRLSAAGFDPTEILQSAVAGPAAVKAKLLSSLFRALRSSQTHNTARLEGEKLFTQGADAVEQVLQQLAHPQNLLSRAQTRSAIPLTSVLDALFVRPRNRVDF